MIRSNVTPMDALRRCVEAMKQIDFADCKDERVWQALGAAQGVAEGVLRDYVEPWWLSDKIIAYASSKPGFANRVISKAQFDNALPKNRTEYDVALGLLDVVSSKPSLASTISPFAFVIVDEKGNPEFVTPDHQSAQEHINDACAQGDIDGAGKWKSIPVFEMRPTDDKLWYQTIRDRDTYHDWSDKLAEAIAKHFGVDIGEHSNVNLPWAEALAAINDAAPAASSAAPAGEVELRKALQVARAALKSADFAIKGREHCGFINNAIAVIDAATKE